MGKNKRMTTIIVAGIILLTIVGVAFAYYNVVIANGTRQNLSATTVESVNLTLDDNDATSYSGQLNYGSTITKNLKLTNEGGPTKVALYFQDLINTYTAGAFTYTLSYATTENGSYTAVATDVAIPRRSKASSTAKIQEIEMPATTTRYYKMVITYNHLETVDQTRDLTATFNTGFTIKAVPKTIAEAHPDGDYMKDFCVADANGNCTTDDYEEGYLLGNHNIYSSQIYGIDFFNTISIPSGATSWDVSHGQNGSVMAWVTNHEFEEFYTSQSDCQADLNAGTVNRCVQTENYSYYVRRRKSTGVLQTTKYNSLSECQSGLGSTSLYECVEQIGTYKGYITEDDAYDLNIGQEGGVIANPDSSYLFAYMYMSNFDFNNFDTQYVTKMSYMFYHSTSIMEVDLSSASFSNVTNMSHMFDSCINLSTINIELADTTHVTTMSAMFNGCRPLTSLDFSNFDTANVTDMSYMFGGCQKVTSLDLSSFDTSNVTNMAWMFNSMTNLINLDISSFNTACVTNMAHMFYYIGNTVGLGNEGDLTLDLSNFDTANVTDMSSMFYSSWNIGEIDLSSFDTANVTNFSAMFGRLYAEELDVSNFVVKEGANVSVFLDAPTAHLKTVIYNDDNYEKFNASLNTSYSINRYIRRGSELVLVS